MLYNNYLLSEQADLEAEDPLKLLKKAETTKMLKMKKKFIYKFFSCKLKDNS